MKKNVSNCYHHYHQRSWVQKESVHSSCWVWFMYVTGLRRPLRSFFTWKDRKNQYSERGILLVCPCAGHQSELESMCWKVLKFSNSRKYLMYSILSRTETNSFHYWLTSQWFYSETEKAANSHIWQSKTIKYLAFLLEKWLNKSFIYYIFVIICT